jgi:cell division protein FtsQ
VVLISLSNVISKDLKWTEIVVKITNNELNEFIDEKQVFNQIKDQLTYPQVGGKLIHNDISRVEKLLKNNKFVENAQVVSDHKGKIIISIVQELPIARVISKKGNYYITKNGTKMPLSQSYTARVVLLIGDKIDDIMREDTLNDLEYRSQFIEMLNYMYNNEFLKAQISEIDVLDNRKMILYPLVSSQKILFGDCENYVDKFEKLQIFYSQILPRKGWNTYSKVNLDYSNQIICE